MSHIIPHGVFTTRKLTGNPWPPDWYLENPMFPYLHQWADFARRAGGRSKAALFRFQAQRRSYGQKRILPSFLI